MPLSHYHILNNLSVKPLRPRAFGLGYNFRTTARDGAYVCYDDLTPRTYSYLAICQGRGSVVACAVMPQRRLREALPCVVDGFRSRVKFDMGEPKYFAATVAMGIPHTAQRYGRIYAGEAAGLQDVFAGFGIRIAITTGHMAARSLLDGTDYDALWQSRYRPVMQAAAVNRWLQERFGNRGYTWPACPGRVVRPRPGQPRQALGAHLRGSFRCPAAKCLVLR